MFLESQKSSVWTMHISSSQFSEQYGFVHVMSVSHFPRSNCEAEKNIQTAKKILKQDYHSYPCVQGNTNSNYRLQPITTAHRQTP